ncbi:MAG: hypothetical protein IPI30_15170 [Saprospiraceae bacterium]|nr:hypothetical protein [Candidatus Vicinibacter affinis]
MLFWNDEGKGKIKTQLRNTILASNIELHLNLLELEEAQSENAERISCMEEVRTSEGYVTELYLNSTDSLLDATKLN